MERSLSVLLVVENAQSTLAGTAGEILEILPELTGRFELVIIDDGSSDDTLAVADELAARYPQVTVVRHGQPKGREAAIRTGVRHSHGEIVFLCNEHCSFRVDALHKVWRELDEHEPVLGKTAAQRSFPRTGSRFSTARTDPAQVARSRTKQPNYLAKLRDFAFGE